jgi:hypothetical protein
MQGSYTIQMVHISVCSCEFSGFSYLMKRKHLVFHNVLVHSVEDYLKWQIQY